MALDNVHDDIRADVAADSLALEVAESSSDLFRLSYYRKARLQRAEYTVVYLKPTNAISGALLIERELLCVIMNFADVQARTLNVAKELIAGSNNRLERTIAVVVHCDPRGDDKLRAWGREAGLVIIPIYRPPAGLPNSTVLRRQLASELFSADPFQVTGPVVNDLDFFGRGNDAAELLRQLEAGRIRGLFGIRKVGKTSMLNRVIRLARDRGSSRVAVIDCTLKEFNSLTAADAIRAVGKVVKMAATQGYAHVSDAVARPNEDLLSVFREMWEIPGQKPLIIVFDEIDYVTPESQANSRWKTEFNSFWRDFRAFIQEAQRHHLTISLLVSGVSSKSFRAEQVDGVENAVLHFVPEEYLSPFAPGAAEAMIRDLGARCGLRFDDEAKKLIGEVSGYFPFWIRMLGSHLHHGIDVESRPLEVGRDIVEPLVSEFLAAEGADIAYVALMNLRRTHPEVIEELRVAAQKSAVPLRTGRLIARYGLGQQQGMTVSIQSQMVRAGLELLESSPQTTPRAGGAEAIAEQGLALNDLEWAEELAVISRRHNLLERKLREFVRFSLKFNAQRGESWTDLLTRALPEKRRAEVAPLSGEALLQKLYWKELELIINKYWTYFEPSIGDKRRFQLSMGLLNDRPNAHAKDIDMADVALLRRELAWLEERVTG